MAAESANARPARRRRRRSRTAVSGFLNFELLDEDRLGGWQSGLLWRDRTSKPTYDVFKAVIAEVRRRDIDCSNVPGAPQG